ncbi:MAG: hypothetical protein FWD34_05050 [Oscillospiraceae bacterium]|nr:hypothetical protein [Oscillospiraceae bacterium]
MKKLIVLIITAAILFTACGNSDVLDVSEELSITDEPIIATATTATTTVTTIKPALPATEPSEETSWEEYYSEQGITWVSNDDGVDCDKFDFTYISLSGDLEEHYDIPTEYADKLKELGIFNRQGTNVFPLGEYFVVSSYGETDDDWFPGNTSYPLYWYVFSENHFTAFDIVPHCVNNGSVFIANDILYIYDTSFTAGFQRIGFWEYSIATGERINEYWRHYQLAQGGGLIIYEENSTMPIMNSRELEEYMLGISDVWYS